MAMKAYVDRIEEGRTAVLLVEGAGEIHLPAGLFPFKLHEGMHLDLQFKPDGARESAALSRVQKLQRKLLDRSRG